ncbi:hypothetical protein H0H87_011848 [Tephrocybe sp. NHM501043]|nr:hypothetical protein H0H87_011848 [Tephrocybe sp. NHM501043]
MTLVDSADSILMLYSYTGFPEKSWVFFERTQQLANDTPEPTDLVTETTKEKVLEAINVHDTTDIELEKQETVVATVDVAPSHTYEDAEVAISVPAATDGVEGKVSRDTAVKMNVMSGLSIILTLMSILMAFSISLITIMGLIEEQCARCRRAAEAEDGGGLEGRWWSAWARANDNSGYIGVAIVGSFLTIVAVWHGIRWTARKIASKRAQISSPSS